MKFSRTQYLLISAVIILVCSVAMSTTLTAFLVNADKALMLTLTFREHTSFDMFWYYYTNLTCWIPLITILLFTLWLWHPSDNRHRLLLMVSIVLLILVLDQTSSGLIKPFVERLRPSHDSTISESLNYVNGYRGGRYGFVSGHATNIVGIATWLCHIFRSRIARAVFIIFAVTLCYSRIYLGVHFPGDIICGSILGYTLARIAIALLSGRNILFTTDRTPWMVLAAYLLTVVSLLCINGYLLMSEA